MRKSNLCECCVTAAEEDWQKKRAMFFLLLQADNYCEVVSLNSVGLLRFMKLFMGIYRVAIAIS